MTSTDEIVFPLLAESMPEGATRLMELPAFALPAKPGGYYHVPRSAFLWVTPGRGPYGLISVHFWCGQARRVAPDQFTSRPPDDHGHVCGTCLGRREGFDRRRSITYGPRSVFDRPRRCPGDDWTADRRTCHVCGAKVQAARGWNAWGDRPTSARRRDRPDRPLPVPRLAVDAPPWCDAPLRRLPLRVRDPTAMSEPIPRKVTRWFCPHCDRSFPTRRGAAEHMRTCDDSPGRRSCGTCVHLCHHPDPDISHVCNVGLSIPTFGCPSWVKGRRRDASGGR